MVAKYSELPDQKLVSFLKEDNEHAFVELYERYKGVLHVHAYKKLGDFEEAKDVVQELFVNIWDKRYVLPDTTNFSGYLYRGLRNRIFNIFAHNEVKAQYATAFMNSQSEASVITDESVRANELAQQIEAAVNELPDKMREVFLLSREGQLSHKEIAERLSISEHTVKNHIKKALKSLRAKLGFAIFFFYF